MAFQTVQMNRDYLYRFGFFFFERDLLAECDNVIGYWKTDVIGSAK